MRHLNFKRYVVVILAYLLIIQFIACKDDKKDGSKETAVNATGSSSLKINCIRLERSQIQAWVDSGWTNPKYAGRIKTLLFQFYTARGTNASENMQLIAYPGQTVSDVRVTGRANLSIDTTCTSLDIPGGAILSNNAINIKDLKIFNTDGSLTDFDFIRLKPVFGPGDYISFETEVVKVDDNKETIMMMQPSHPCPPYCPPPPGGNDD